MNVGASNIRLAFRQQLRRIAKWLDRLRWEADLLDQLRARAEAEENDIRVTTRVSDFPPETADALIARGTTASAARRMFADSLRYTQ